MREFVQLVGVKSVMCNELSVEVYGLDELRHLAGPAVLVANHASHLDTAVLLSTLPSKRRRRTAVGIVGDYFFESWLIECVSDRIQYISDRAKGCAYQHCRRLAHQRLECGRLSRRHPIP